MPSESAGIIERFNQLQEELKACRASEGAKRQRIEELEYEVAACKDVAQEIREHDKELYRMLESIADGELAPDAPMVRRMLERVR